MVIKKKVIEEKEIIKQEGYTPVFETITITKNVKYDLNWIAVRRKIQSINIFKLDYIKKAIEKESKKTHKEKYGFNYKEVWNIYSDWFNNTFNGGK